MLELDQAYANPRSLIGRFNIWFDTEYVCVLTIGKTASSAIIESLHSVGVKAFQVHSLSRAPQNHLFFSEERPFFVQNSLYKLKMAAWMFTQRNEKRRFITTFRDPFERNLSAFFEQMWKIPGVSFDDDADTLLYSFQEKGPHDATSNWYRDNLGRKFGLGYNDVNLVEVPTRIARVGGKTFLFLKYERRDCWELAISEFIGVPVKLERRNVSSNKPYAQKMKEVKSLWRPSQEIIRRTIDPELWNALYTSKEKSDIREKWGIAKWWLQ